MLSPGDTVVTGVSGGADSVCLLLVLSVIKKEIPFRLLAVHVNHQIRPEAQKDAEFVRDLCRQLSVPFFLVTKDVGAIAEKKGISTEEAGRQVRYAAFEQVLWEEAAEAVSDGSAKIAVAHNLNDRAETMLFNLFRGSGISGLCSIRPVRSGREGTLVIRPLLSVTRKEIEDFLKGKGIGFCIDSTNEEDTYTRNRIRHHILPFAEKEITCGVVSNMGRAADILSETEDFVQTEAKKAYIDCIVKTDEAESGVRAGGETAQALDAARLLSYHPLLRKQVILHCIYELTPERKDITGTHVEDVLSLFTKSGSREIHLPYDIVVRREYKLVLFEKRADREKNSCVRSLSVELPSPGGPALNIPLSETETMEFTVFTYEKTVNIPQNQYTKWFDYDKIVKPLVIRTREPGDYLAFNAAFSKKTIQDYMVEEKIPRQKRDAIWLLAEEKHILWVTGYRISSYYKTDENTRYILQVRLRGGQ